MELITPDGVRTGLRGFFDINDKDIWKWNPEIAPFIPDGKRLRKPVYISELGLSDDLHHKLMYGSKIFTVEELENVPDEELAAIFNEYQMVSTM